MTIKVEQAMQLGYCCKGMRKWALRHGLDWNDILDNGLPEEVLIATGDGMAIRLVEVFDEQQS